MRPKFLLSIFFVVVFFPAVPAEKPNLNALVEAALNNDPNQLKAAKNLAAAEEDATAERKQRLLSGSVSGVAGIGGTFGSTDINASQTNSYKGTFSTSSMAIAGSTVNLATEYAYEQAEKVKSDSATLTAGISLPVFINGKFIDTRLEEAAKAVAIDIPLETARTSAATQERDTVDSVLRLALDAATANRTSEIADRSATLAERDVTIADVKRKQGSLSYSDLAKIEKEADEAKLTALESRLSRDKKLRSLCAATGFTETEIDLSVLLAPEYDDEKIIKNDVTMSEVIQNAARERKKEEMARILVGTENAPNLAVSTTTTLPGPVTQNFKDNSAWRATATVTIPLPVGIGTAKRNAADARVDAARLNEQAAIRTSSDGFRALNDALTSSQARVSLRETLLEQAKVRLRDILSSFNGQTATKLDVDRAELAVDEADAALEDARTAHFEAVLDIYSFCGQDPRDLL